MDGATCESLTRHLLDIQFSRCPAKDSEYWLFGSPASSVAALRTLPSLLGLDWAWQGDELVVDFVDGPESGESELFRWPEFAEVAAGSHRLLARWTGLRLPVRVIICPGLGVRVAIEHMDERELRVLHERVSREFVESAIERMSEHPILVGCDTRGIARHDPERLLGQGGKLPTMVLCPDYLLCGREVVQAGVEPDAHQTMERFGELCLISAAE